MSKFLGYLDYKDDAALDGITKQYGSEYSENYNNEAFWDEALQDAFEHGEDSTEVRVRALDYVIVEHIPLA